MTSLPLRPPTRSRCGSSNVTMRHTQRMDLSTVSSRDLLTTYAQILTHLANRASLDLATPPLETLPST